MPRDPAVVDSRVILRMGPAALQMAMRSHYDTLGVTFDTHPAVIKAAYRALAKEYHPDGAASAAADADRFIEIQAAYAVLSDPEARDAYDQELRDAVMGASPGGIDGEFLQSVTPTPAGLAQGGDAERIAARLGIYSEALAASFRAALLTGAAGEDPTGYAAALERSFFREYFGEDADIQALARLLLLRSQTSAALALNELVAGTRPAGSADLRSTVAQIVDRHLVDDGLFAEWLKARFGASLPDAATAEDVPLSRVHGIPVEAQAAADMGVSSHPTGTLRSFAALFLWTFAFYFGLFAAFPLVE